MINLCVFDPIALEAWYSDEESSLFIQTELEKYLQNYSSCFCSEPQRKLFRTFIRGLLSSLDRKSIEPIALHFSGVKYVRPLQQFFSRSPFKEQSLLDIYQELLSGQVVEENGMLSVDDTGFVKKGKHSAGVKRQYCGRLGKTENCQSGVFLAYAGKNGYGLVDCELYLPQEWFSQDFAQLYKECRIPEDKEFSTKNEIAQRMLNRAMCSGLFQARWVGCDAAYGNDHDFLDGLELPKGVWYFAATNAKEQVFREYPEMFYPERGRGRPRKHPVLSGKPVSVQEIAEEPSIPWETVVLAEGAKGPIMAERKCIRCFACRKDGNRNYVKAGEEIWLYLRKYADGEIKYFVSNAPGELPVHELDRAATLRWPIEQCFEECKSSLGMGHYECRSYQGWKRHMLFVMIAHLFASSIREIFKKKQSP
ncbi:IS701 family transposase, partial [Lachnospiraceae bacterium 45-P1]